MTDAPGRKKTRRTDPPKVFKQALTFLRTAGALRRLRHCGVLTKRAAGHGTAKGGHMADRIEPVPGQAAGIPPHDGIQPSGPCHAASPGRQAADREMTHHCKGIDRCQPMSFCASSG